MTASSCTSATARRPPLHASRQTSEHRPELLRRGPSAVLYAIVDQVVDDYEPVIEGLDNDINEVEL